MTHFPAKLLLFGEYSILLGSSALSSPFTYFSASLKFINDEAGDLLFRARESNCQLKQMCDYFTENSSTFNTFLDLSLFSNDISNGLYLASTIPRRYGLGSSGALCAAVYDSYGTDRFDPSHQPVEHDLVALRNRFIGMESYFHGRSSGFDPLVSFLKTRLLLRKDGAVVPVDFQVELMHGKEVGILLVDSGQPCSTGPLVADFLAEFAPGGNITPPGADLCNLANSSIEKLLGKQVDAFWNEITRLSHFQLTNLHPLIPEALRPLWTVGLKTGLFTLKLCGSGGGGFLLCFTHDKEGAVKYFNDRQIPYLPVDFATSLPL